jgi:hypothetical protein
MATGDERAYSDFAQETQVEVHNMIVLGRAEVRHVEAPDTATVF